MEITPLFSLYLLSRFVIEERNLYLTGIVLACCLVITCCNAHIEYLREKYIHRKRAPEEELGKNPLPVAVVNNRLPEEILNAPVYRLFAKDSGKRSADEWNELEHIVDKVYTNFTQKLYRLHPFSSYELQICLLLKIHIRPSDIAQITSHTKESVTATRRRMYEKVFHTQGTPKLWDEFILSL